MKINSNGKLMVLARNSRDGQNRQKYYNLAILFNGEAGNLSCTEEVYDVAVVPGSYNVVFEFNTEYKSIRIVDAYLDSEPGTMQTTEQENKPGAKPDKSGK